MISRDRNYLIQIARNYYVDGLSQAEIGEKYNISRPTVSNLLKQCLEEKIVEIRIQESDNSLVTALAERLKESFNLDSAVVVPSGDSSSQTLATAGGAAAEILSTMLKDRMKIGLSWGSSVYHAVQALPVQSVVDVEVIQLAGSLGMANPAFDGFELARSLALKLNGSCRLIQAPVVVKNPELKRLLLLERPISETMSRMNELDMALVGLSSDNPEFSSKVREGFQSVDEAKAIQAAGGVGHICGLHYDRNGQFLKIAENEKVVGIEAENLKKIPKIIALACGSEKADAILGALRGGLVTTMVTDEHAALRMLSNL